MSVCHFISKNSVSSTHFISSYSHAHMYPLLSLSQRQLCVCIVTVTIMHNISGSGTYTTSYQIYTEHSHVMYACATKESRQTSTSQRNPSLHLHLHYTHRTHHTLCDWKNQESERLKATAKVHICKRNTCIVVCLAHHKINIIYCDGFESERRLTIFLFVPNKCVETAKETESDLCLCLCLCLRCALFCSFTAISTAFEWLCNGDNIYQC